MPKLWIRGKAPRIDIGPESSSEKLRFGTPPNLATRSRYPAADSRNKSIEVTAWNYAAVIKEPSCLGAIHICA
jgi:hypothetical protein